MSSPREADDQGQRLQVDGVRSEPRSLSATARGRPPQSRPIASTTIRGRLPMLRPYASQMAYPPA
jgi:hypothetical protein